jgi:glutaredoxin-related protein
MDVWPKHVADNLNKIVNNYWNRVVLDGNPWTWPNTRNRLQTPKFKIPWIHWTFLVVVLFGGTIRRALLSLLALYITVIVPLLINLSVHKQIHVWEFIVFCGYKFQYVNMVSSSEKHLNFRKWLEYSDESEYLDTDKSSNTVGVTTTAMTEFL